MMIPSSTSLHNGYNAISDFCKEQNYPVFLAKNGEGNIVVMSMKAYSLREKMHDLREKLLNAEVMRLPGAKTSLDELNEQLEILING